MLESQIRIQQKQVDDFQEALQVIIDRPRYEPPTGTLPPLDFMKEQLKAARSKEERDAAIALAQESLDQASAALNSLKAEAAIEQAKLDELTPQIAAACKNANALAVQWIASLQQVKALTDAANPVSQRLKGQSVAVRWRSIEAIPMLEANGCKVVMINHQTNLCQTPSSIFG